MRIAVNTRLLLSDKLEGIGWFTHETLSRITRAHPEHQFIFFFDRPFDERFIYGPNVQGIVLWPPTRHPLLYRMWFGRSLPEALLRHEADVLLSPDGFLALRSTIAQLAVIHDLNFEHHPEDMPHAYQRYYRTFFPLFARKASRIVTVSEFSRQDIVAQYGIDPTIIDVAHNGVSEVYRPLSEDEKVKAREKFTGGEPCFVCVGALSPRKNIARLLQAFDQFAARNTGVKLLVVGNRMWWDKRMKSAWKRMKHKDRVVFTGRLGQQDLRLAMGASMARVYVSYFEGFGIPVAEAMKCGVPVIAAQATSLPEGAGDAAIYCDPFNVDDIARCMTEIAGDAALRERLSVAGIERAKAFSWERTADALWASLLKMTSGSTTSNSADGPA